MMKAVTRTAIGMLLVVIITPLLLIGVNRTLISRIYALPHGIRTADSPFYTFMQLTPNFRGESLRLNLYSGVTRHTYTTNSLGLRGGPLPQGQDLIVFSCDSTIFGLDLDDTDTIPAQMGKILQNRAAVVNAGIPGKALPHNLLTLEQMLNLAEKRGVRLRVFINWLSPGDLSHINRTPDDLRRLSLRHGLTWKESLAERFPLLHHVYWRLRRPWNITAPIRAAVDEITRKERTCPPQPPRPAAPIAD